MLKKTKQILLVIFSISLILTNCTDTQINKTESTLIDIPIGSTLEGIMLPPGSKYEFVNGQSEIRIVFPKDYVFIGYNKDNQIEVLSGETYTCTCSTATGGCNVFYLTEPKEFGCTHGSCSGTCSGQKGRTLAGSGYMNLNEGVSFTTRDKAKNLLPAFDAMFELPEVIEQFKKFEKSVYDNNVPDLSNGLTDNYKLVAINAFGTLLQYAIPNETYESNRALFEFEGGGDYTCKCSSGTSGCSKEQTLKEKIAGVYRCTGGTCSQCTMTVN